MICSVEGEAMCVMGFGESMRKFGERRLDGARGKLVSLQQKVFMVSVGNLYFVSAPATDTICTIQKMNGL
jgi:hypothetical protein